MSLDLSLHDWFRCRSGSNLRECVCDLLAVDPQEFTERGLFLIILIDDQEPAHAGVKPYQVRVRKIAR